jgi:hypothetical protein
VTGTCEFRDLGRSRNAETAAFAQIISPHRVFDGAARP